MLLSDGFSEVDPIGELLLTPITGAPVVTSTRFLDACLDAELFFEGCLDGELGVFSKLEPLSGPLKATREGGINATGMSTFCEFSRLTMVACRLTCCLGGIAAVGKPSCSRICCSRAELCNLLLSKRASSSGSASTSFPSIDALPSNFPAKDSRISKSFSCLMTSFAASLTELLNIWSSSCPSSACFSASTASAGSVDLSAKGFCKPPWSVSSLARMALLLAFSMRRLSQMSFWVENSSSKRTQALSLLCRAVARRRSAAGPDLSPTPRASVARPLSANVLATCGRCPAAS
mmetsp:Transcript_52314/g.118152  ORF Transcript_52314/g.118152 Transcript_52314/m.118152 type:complete len:291 (+) Transcript_52314:243-1115(+)